MTHDRVVKEINDIRNRYTSVVKHLQQQETIPSFRTLVQTTPIVRDAFERAVGVSENPRVSEWCRGTLNCAIIGSSGHGKTTMLDEMFPGLSKRGLLVTDVTDTTSQALHISYAKTNDDLNEVFVNSWNREQIGTLMDDADVRKQNATDGINVDYLADRLVVDGTSAKLQGKQSFKFGSKIELRPFPQAYRVPAEKLADPTFVRALTVKQTAEHIDRGTIISIDGQSYNSIQLRALVKEVRLKDRYENIFRWSRRTPEEATRLQFIDTPGISVQGSEKDELLRHFLGKKSNHIALQMWMNDDLDIIIHLVLCVQKSDFAELWKTIEHHCEPGQIEDLSDRLVLAINGTSRYFSDDALIRKYNDPENAHIDGDHFSTTIEDNILQKMSPRGRIKPARICFFDSKRIVEADKRQSYADYYQSCKPTMLQWTEPSGVGYSTLSNLGIVESFKKNIDALVDPDDQGKGYLVRQIFDLADEKGPYLLIKKYLIRTRVNAEVENLLEVLCTYYDEKGVLNRKAVLAALQSCLAFLDQDDPTSLEQFASESIDPAIDQFDFREAHRMADNWGKAFFVRMAAHVKKKILESSNPPPEISEEFSRHFDSQVPNWITRWGYDSFVLPPPSISAPTSADLMQYCLKLHSRDILLRLLAEHESTGDSEGFRQTAEDRKDILQIIKWLQEAKAMTQKLCTSYGVSR